MSVWLMAAICFLAESVSLSERLPAISASFRVFLAARRSPLSALVLASVNGCAETLVAPLLTSVFIGFGDESFRAGAGGVLFAKDCEPWRFVSTGLVVALMRELGVWLTSVEIGPANDERGAVASATTMGL